MAATATGPLSGVRLVEVGGVGPVPFCGMVLADLGADVISVQRLPTAPDGKAMSEATGGVLARGRRSIAVDLKHPDGVATVLRLLERADGLLEGFRPGVMERLGLGPDVCSAVNPRLVYGRMTGWGQDGPYAQLPGHDINYLALSGALGAMGEAGRPPVPPLNLVADFGGGAMLLAVGVLAALLEAGRSGHGQVVDAAMLDGSSLLTTMVHELLGRGAWVPERGRNISDGGAPFYRTYETSDGRYVAVGAMEPQFFDELVSRMGLDQDALPAQWDRSRWPELTAVLAGVFRTRTREEWCALLEHAPVCVTPVLDLHEAPLHPHNVARRVFVDGGASGSPVPAPAPRFGRTKAQLGAPGRVVGADTAEVLTELGLGAEEIARLRASGAIASC